MRTCLAGSLAIQSYFVDSVVPGTKGLAANGITHFRILLCTWLGLPGSGCTVLHDFQVSGGRCTSKGRSRLALATFTTPTDCFWSLSSPGLDLCGCPGT